MELRLLKKYANRKIYDTGVSRYVTLTEIQTLVREDIDFKVIKNVTKEDITKTVLIDVLNISLQQSVKMNTDVVRTMIQEL